MGERRIPAPRERVWRALADPAVLRNCVPDGQITPDGEGGLLLSAAGSSPLRVQPSIREQFSTLGWRIEPAGAASQMALIRLTEQGVYTMLQYEVSLVDGDDAGTGIRADNLRARIDQALERFIHTAAGPGEIGAGGIAGAVQAATDPSGQPNASMHAGPGPGAGPGGASAMLGLLNPSVIGGVLFLIVLLFMVGLF